MADVQIHPLGVENVPASAEVPSAAEWLVKGVFAHFDGSSAAAAWLPVLEIVSDAGTVAYEIPQDASVAAGASVEATWAPFLRGTAAAAAAGATWTFGYNPGTTSTTVASGTTGLLTGDSTGFYTNSPGDFMQDDYFNVTDHYGVRVLTVGHYIGLTYVSVDAGATFPAVGDNYLVQAALADGDFEEGSFFFADNRKYAPVASNAWPSDIFWGELGTVGDPPLEFRHPWIISLTNNGAHDITATCATLIIKLDSDTTFLG